MTTTEWTTIKIVRDHAENKHPDLNRPGDCPVCKWVLDQRQQTARKS